jgi:hypothetical protein
VWCVCVCGVCGWVGVCVCVRERERERITPVFFGDRLLLHVVVLVDTTHFWLYGDTSCAEFCSNEVVLLYKSVVF